MEIVGILFLATLIEGMITYIFGDKENRTDNRNYLKYVSLGLGVALAIIYKVDILAMAGLVTGNPIINYVLSGMIIGRGSNYVNDLIGTIRK